MPLFGLKAFKGTSEAHILGFQSALVGATDTLLELWNGQIVSTRKFAVQKDGRAWVSDGAVATPSLSFLDDTDSGFYRIGVNNVGLALAGAKVVDFLTTGVAVTGTLSASGAVTLSSTLSVTGAVTGGTYNGQTISSAASLTGSLAIATTLNVTGATTLAGLSAATGAFSGAVTGGTYNGQTISSAASLTGTLSVTGAVTLSSTLSISSTLSVTGKSTLTAQVGIGSAADDQAMLMIAGVGDGIASTQRGVYARVSAPTAATVEFRAVDAFVVTQAAAYTVASASGLYVRDPSKGVGSAITTNYGLYLEGQTAGGTNYAIYTNAGLVRFGDDVLIPTTNKLRLDGSASGDTHISEVSANSVNLTVGGTIVTQFTGTYVAFQGLARPWGNLSHGLGDSASRWSSVYAGAGNFSTTLAVTGATTLSGGLTVGSGTATTLTGTVDISGALTVGNTSATTLTGALNVTGDAFFRSFVNIGDGAYGTLSLRSDTGFNLAYFAAVNVAGAWVVGSAINDIVLRTQNVPLHFTTDGGTSKAMTIGATGAVSIAGSLTVGNTMVVTGAVAINSGDLRISATNKLRLDGLPSGDTYIAETAANQLDLVVGAATTLRLTATGAAVTGTLSATGAITQGGTAVSLAGHTHGASEITSGVFGAGTFTFQDTLSFQQGKIRGDTTYEDALQMRGDAFTVLDTINVQIADTTVGVGLFVITNITDGVTGLFAYTGSGMSELASTGAWTTVAGTAGNTNVYTSTSQIRLQNNTGASKSYSIVMIGANFI